MDKITKIGNLASVIFGLLILFFIRVNLYSAEISIVKTQNIETYNEIVDSFIEASERLKGYDIKIYNGENNGEIIQKIFEKLSERKTEDRPVLVITIGPTASFIAQKFMQDIPLIFSGVFNWKKYINTDKHKNIAGVDISLSPEQQLKYLKLIKPELKKLGMLYTQEYTSEIVRLFERIEKSEDIFIISKKVKVDNPAEKLRTEELKKIFMKLYESIDIFSLLPDPVIFSQENFQYLSDACKEQKLPLYSFSEEQTKLGALLSLTPNYSNIGSQMALMARKILIQKILPSDLGVSNPIGSLFSMNFTTAATLNLKVEHLKTIVNKIYY